MKTSKQIHSDATSLLQETEIIALLSDLGSVHIVGSYAANLMWDPDIDIVVVTNSPQMSAVKALNRLIETEQFQKVEFGDFKHHPEENRPQSFIVNARKKWREVNWEIETWFLRALGGQLDLVEKLNNLSDQDKQKLLEKKKQRALSGKSKQDIPSWRIYQEFLK